MKTLLALLFVSALFAQSPLPLKSKDWTVTGWKVRTSDLALVGNSNIRLGNDSSGDLTFDFPTYSGGSTFQTVNYLFAPFTAPLNTQLVITLTVATTGTPVFQWQTEAGNNCTSNCSPAAARPYFQSSFTGTCADGNNYQWCNRWWSDSAYYVLAPGSVTLTIPLDPSQWSTVNGASGLIESKAWSFALKNPSQIGFTFGGGYFFGHGIYVTGGTAQFQLSSYSVQ